MLIIVGAAANAWDNSLLTRWWLDAYWNAQEIHNGWWFVIKVKKKPHLFMFVHGWLIVDIRCFTLKCSYLVCFVSIPTFCIIQKIPTRISLRRGRCLVKAGLRRKEKVSTAAGCQWCFCGKKFAIFPKKKVPSHWLVKGTFWKNSKKILIIQGSWRSWAGF